MGTQSHYPVSLASFSEPLLSIGPPSIHPLSLPIDLSSGATSHIRETTQGRRKKRKNVHAQDRSYGHATTIGVLPDDVLLEIFDLCRRNRQTTHVVWNWHLLVHVCGRWRQIVFASPRRLNLQILCTRSTPVRRNLGIWPAFPIVIDCLYFGSSIPPNDEDNVVAALQHPDRICDVKLDVAGSQLGNMAAVMQEPFPVLTRLYIASKNGNAPVLPAKFLGGSAPCLQEITLSAVPFPALPTLLASTSNLVTLSLRRIPPTGYISPEAMLTCLATLHRLDTFHIEFQSATPRPDRMHQPPVTRTVLPALTSFTFKGASEYLEDLVARIDGPRLSGININYLNQLIDFQAAQLSKFIDRSVGPEVTSCEHARVTFSSDKVSFNTYRHENHPSSDWRPVTTDISCQGIDWQVSHIAQVLSQFSTALSNVVHLKLEADPEEDRQGTDDVEWLHLLRQFSTVRALHVSPELAGHVALALDDAAGLMVAEALPSLHLISLPGQPASSIEKFVAARQLSGHPVIVIDTVIGTQAVERENRCPVCGVHFKQSQALNRHMKDKHGDKLTCPHCSSFKWSRGRPYLYKRHLCIKHPELPANANSPITA